MNKKEIILYNKIVQVNKKKIMKNFTIKLNKPQQETCVEKFKVLRKNKATNKLNIVLNKSKESINIHDNKEK